MYRLVEDMRGRLAAAFPGRAGSGTSGSGGGDSSSSGSSSSSGDWPPIRVAGYGHLGDGNLHLNISGKGASAASSGMPPICRLFPRVVLLW